MALDHFTIRGDCAFFRPVGDATWRSFVALLEQAISECRAGRLTKLLANVEMLTHAPLTLADRYGLATELARIADRSLNIVLVVRPDHRDKRKFVQLVAGNRGLVIGVAGSEEEALNWLDSRSGRSST